MFSSAFLSASPSGLGDTPGEILQVFIAPLGPQVAYHQQEWRALLNCMFYMLISGSTCEALHSLALSSPLPADGDAKASEIACRKLCACAGLSQEGRSARKLDPMKLCLV
ncbi:hypothetical protein EPA93_10060 [Ktedonosporobacter rubrisoli]|uniref:Uncharacterized protein n=1 Tax=Ktedonosporobacter rubrisoli TaxID=2509675 RepID=A0A4P6JMS7_KTERU|nr:hypothetical protein [Ktedonosporobacter rubrisoli]QBD76332.1 hypothetical protein EPA93_10060 [Ktedonosporobacter rubrisoli]